MSILSTSSKLVRVGDSYSAGEGISIENNVISVTGDYGHAYSAGDNISISDDNVISSKDWSSDIDTAAQNVSAETTAWVDSQNYLTDADMSDYALITDVETTSGLLKMDIDTVSASITGKMDSTAFNAWQNGQYASDIGVLTNNIDTVSGAVDNLSATIEGLDIPTHQEIIDASGYAYSQSTAWTDSQGYLTAHQDISNLATKDEVSAYTLTTTLEQVSGDIVSQIPSIEGLATKSEVDTVSSFLSGAIDYVSANAGDEFPASANDAITAYQNASGTYLTAHQSLDGYLTKSSADTLYQPIGSYASQTDLEQVSGDLKSDIDYISGVAITAHQDLSNYATTGDLNTASSFLSGAIDDVSGQIPVIPDMSANEWNSVYDSVESNSSLWNEMTAYQNASGTFLTAHQSLDNYYTKSETSGATELADAFSNIPAGDADVNAYVQGNSATINDVNSTVQSNSAQWAEGTSVDTIPVAVISPLVTGFSGESAYLGIESTALNLSSYVPVSAIGVNSQGYVSSISGMNISAYRAAYATNASYASRAHMDSNSNVITSYYQPKLTISGDAGTITAINGSAVGASIPEGWELVAGQGIEIVDDAENNQTTISVTAAGGDPEVESVVKSNSATWNEISVYETNSASYLTAHQDISDKLDTTAFSDVSGSFLTGINIPESATWNDVASVYQTNSSTYLTAETDWSNTITAASSYAYSEAVAQIPAPFDPTYMSGAIDYISGVAITALPGDLATTGDINDLAQSISETYQVKGDYLTTADSANFYPMTGNPSGFLTSHQDISNKLDTTAFSDVSGTFLTAVNIPESANWEDATTAYQTNSATYLTAHQAISANEWNSNYETVTTNSGAWGGSALNISAGPGIKVNLVDNTLVFSNDETMLYTANAASNTIVLSEKATNFERLRLELQSYQSTMIVNYTEVKPNDNYLTFFAQTLIPAATYPLQILGVQFSSTNGITYNMSRGVRAYYKTTSDWGGNDTTDMTSNIKDAGFITKIVGINRIAGGN